MRADPGTATVCWHPSASKDFVEQTNGAMVRVLAGDPAYQLSTGVIVKL